MRLMIKFNSQYNKLPLGSISNLLVLVIYLVSNNLKYCLIQNPKYF